METFSTAFADVWLLRPQLYVDGRGCLQELHNKLHDAAHDLPDASGLVLSDFAQTNYTQSARHVLRGLHFQQRNPQGKLLTVLRGEIMDVVVNIDPQSPQFGQHITSVLGDAQQQAYPQQVWIAAGYAHGFFVRSDGADVLYHCTQSYDPNDQAGLRWDDPQLAIDWQLPAGVQPIISERDARWQCFADYAAERCGKNGEGRGRKA